MALDLAALRKEALRYDVQALKNEVIKRHGNIEMFEKAVAGERAEIQRLELMIQFREEVADGAAANQKA